jgi:DNA repair protein RadC
MSEYRVRITDLPESERPRERLINFGAESLSNAELLAIILRTGTPSDNVVNMANRILKDFTLGDKTSRLAIRSEDSKLCKKSKPR